MSYSCSITYPCFFYYIFFVYQVSGKKLVDFVAKLDGNEAVVGIAKDSSALATRFPMPGFDVTQMKYNTL